jgi:hypothetical protein
MSSNLLALVLFLALVLAIQGYSERVNATTDVDIHICKDVEKRIFFMGEISDFERMRDLGVFDPKSCVVKKITRLEWRNIRTRHRRSSFIF